MRDLGSWDRSGREKLPRCVCLMATKVNPDQAVP